MRRNPLKDFPHEHPWMTFFLGLAAINGVVTLVRGFPPPIQIGPTTPPATTTPSSSGTTPQSFVPGA